MAEMTRETQSFGASFSDLEKIGSANGSAWVHEIRKAAFARFGELGFPTPRHEEWKYTNVAPLKKHAFQLNPSGGNGTQIGTADLQPFIFEGMTPTRLVFVDGHFAPGLSTTSAPSPGVEVASFATAFSSHGRALQPHLTRHASFDEHAFVALNTAFLQDGAFVHVARGAVGEAPVHLLFVSTASARPTVSHPRVLIVLEQNAQLTVVEDYVSLGDGVHFTNAVTEVALAENAGLEYARLQRENDAAFHISSLAVTQSRDSRLASNAVCLGGALLRNDVNASLNDEGIACTLNGLTVANGTQHIDNHTRIEHAKPNCNSWELYKAVLDGKAHGVFNGKIYVAPDAQKTDAKQTNQSLLLSRTAAMDTKPELEIYADDVRCTHGATIGQLEEESLFYLRTRGLDKEKAINLLTFAFASDVVNQVKIEQVRTAIEKMLYDKLPKSFLPEG